MSRWCLVGVLLLISAGCTTLQVSSDYNPQTDFTRLKTYAWLNEADKPSDDIRMNNEIVRQSVRQAIDENLEARGYSQTGQEKADFLVTWFGAIEQRLKVQSIDHFYASYGYGPLFRDPTLNPSPDTAVSEYEEGSLIVDFLDPENQRVIWRGRGEDRIVPGRPEQQVRSNLKRAVNQILAGFPPP